MQPKPSRTSRDSAALQSTSIRMSAASTVPTIDIDTDVCGVDRADKRHRYGCLRRRLPLQPACFHSRGLSTAMTGEPVSLAGAVNAAASQRRSSVKQSSARAGQTRPFARPLGKRAGQAGSDAAQSTGQTAEGMSGRAGSSAHTNGRARAARTVECSHRQTGLGCTHSRVLTQTAAPGLHA